MPPTSIIYDTPVPIGVITTADYSPGALLPGSSITFEESIVGTNVGLVDALLSYEDPLTVSGEPTNFMYLYFDLLTPFDSFPQTTTTRLSTSVSTPGTNPRCTSTQPSGGVSIGDSDFIQDSFTCIPEPGTYLLVALGLTTIVSMASRRKPTMKLG